MLRAIVLALACVGLVGAAALVSLDPSGWPALLLPLLVLVGILGERFYYRGNDLGASGGIWKVTPERFHDEERGRLVTVWYNSTTGERRYIEDGEAPPGQA